MVINGVEIKPGKKATIDIPVATLPSATKIDVVAHVYRARKPGPTALFLGGIHGDEINGIEIVRRAEKEKLFSKLKMGAVIAIPLLNVYGFINSSRDLPDGKDLNRNFPGKKSGSLASRLAYTLTKEILPHVDFAIDFHTGGKSLYNFPQVRVFKDDEASIELAKEFNMPFIIHTGLIKKSLRKIAHTNDIPMLVFEGGEAMRLDETSIAAGMKGIQRVLYAKGMVDQRVRRVRMIEIPDNRWIRATRSGMFISMKKSGDTVKKGEVLGQITGPFGNFQVKIKARRDAIIFGHNNSPVVNQGDALFHIGF